jgi:hypothetical protein
MTAPRYPWNIWILIGALVGVMLISGAVGYLANTTNPNSPRESALSAESFVPGVIGDPERRFQIRLGILCMMATGLAFAGWLAWGLVWLLLRLCGRNWKRKPRFGTWN